MKILIKIENFSKFLLKKIPSIQGEQASTWGTHMCRQYLDPQSLRRKIRQRYNMSQFQPRRKRFYFVKIWQKFTQKKWKNQPDLVLDSESRSSNGKMKTKWEGHFFEKKSNETIGSSLCSESNVGIFDSLEPFGGELWRFEKLKFVQHLEPTQNFFGKFFLFQ